MAAGPRLGIVRRWWWLVLVGAALGAGAAFVAVRSMPPIYRATSTLLVTPPNDASLSQSFARTYARMAVHPVVLARVHEMLELKVSPGRLESAVSAHPVPDTQLIEIVVQLGDAAVARDIANATVQAFIDQQAAQLPIGPAGPSLRIGQPATVPDQAIGPRQLPALLLGVLVGVLVGLGVAGLMDIPRMVASPPEALPTRAAATDPTAAIFPLPARAPIQSEPVGTTDVLRGLTAVLVATLVLGVPLAAAGGLRGGGPISTLPPAPQARSTPLLAAAPPTVPPATQVAPLTDVPASAPPGLLAPEIPTATPAAEIAGATSAAAPESTPEGPQAPAAPAAARPTSVLFDENFSSGSRLWPSDTQGPAWYEDGGYHLFARNSGQFVAIAAPFRQPLRDATLGGTFRKVDGPSGGIQGLIVRDVGPNVRDGVSQVGNFYMLGIDDRGQYGVWRREGDRWIDLVPLTPSDAIQRGTAANDLTVRAIDDRITLAVNGVEVATVLGAAAQAGAVGVYAGGDFNHVVLSRFQILPATTSAVGAAPREPDVAGVVSPQQPEISVGTTRAPQGFTTAFLRAGPTISAASLASLPNGTQLEILPDTASGDGFTWLRVRTADGVLGWVVSTAVTT